MKKGLIMDAASFEQAATFCGRWSARSIRVVRALLVHGVALKDAASAEGMSPQQAGVLRRRFREKVTQARLRKFMACEAPESLNGHLLEICTLRDRGYTEEQIADYLAQIGIKTSAKQVREFLRKQA